MRTVARFATVMQAMHAAAYLRAGGVKAVQLFDRGDPLGGFLGVDLGIADDDHALAERLLREYHATDPGETEPQAPDLSALDASLAPACPGCGATLPLELIAHCPRCGAAVDVPELIAESHGPEALAECYGPTTSVATPDPESYTRCPHCGYELDGLELDDNCPECGEQRASPPVR